MGTSQTVLLQLPLIAIWRAAEANDALFEIQSREPRGKKFCAQCGNPRTLQCGSCGAQNGREDKFWCVCGRENPHPYRHPASTREAFIATGHLTKAALGVGTWFVLTTRQRDPANNNGGTEMSIGRITYVRSINTQLAGLACSF